MTDHLDEAAAKAVDLAAELQRDPVEPGQELTFRAAAHLTYMAGLLRGGGGRRLKEPSVFVPVSEEESQARLEIDGQGRIRTFDRGGQQVFPDELARVRAQRDELLASGRKVLDQWGNLGGDVYAELNDVVHRIEPPLRMEE